MMNNKELRAAEMAHILSLVGYHVSCIMGQDKPISCSPHRNMPVFERDLTAQNRIHVRNEYMAEVAKLLSTV